MVNKNLFGLRSLALKVFSELIQHCRTTSVVDDQIKLTRQGLQRICMGYIEGLSKLYINTSDSSLTQEDMAQVVRTLQDFSSIAKTVKLSNTFLQSYAQLVYQKE